MKQVSQKLESACSAFEADLVLYYYGDVAEAERRRIESHCQNCFRCRRFLDDLNRLLPQMAKAKPLPADFWDSYYKETVQKLAAQEARGSWWRNLFAPMHVWLIPAFGTVAVAALAVTLVLGKSAWNFQWTPPQQVKIPQEVLADANKVEFFESMDLLESLGVLEKMDGLPQNSTEVRQL
jgi:predicted anti-sigma-YlaC factor YlaD